MEIISLFLANPFGAIAGIAAAAFGLLTVFFSRRNARNKERAVRAEAANKSLEDRMEMHAEARNADDRARDLSDAEARRRAEAYARSGK